MSYRKRQSERLSPAAQITAQIIERLEAGVKPWVRPWRGAPVSRPLRVCGTPYRGMNVFWLWMVADMQGYASPFWMTYAQAGKLGGQVRKGEKATAAILYQSYSKEVASPGADQPSEETRRVLRAYAVFNADQIERLPDRFHPSRDLALVEPEGRRGGLDHFFETIPATVRHLGSDAYYEPGADRITMPPVELFSGYDHYYATRAHELSHWTGHSTRLARDLKSRFGSAAYAAEELIAELSSAILGAELGLPVSHLDSHASYIDHWLTLLRGDDRAILTAAARAEEASALLLSLGRRSGAKVSEPFALAA